MAEVVGCRLMSYTSLLGLPGRCRPNVFQHSDDPDTIRLGLS